MDVGIGLPNAVPGTTGRQITDWAKAAEDADCDELILFPSASDPKQVEPVAEAAGI